ncbi:uncharacterized protein [Dermacentor albipictus]|uniref:uncharacterized protein n=1 Tax=Dermacentor albipictus TaxID=60249 RepID=UPI0031FCAD7E
MKVSVAIVVCMVAVLIMPQVGEAKLGLALAPFVWAANLAKDAALTLVAYKLSLATKALTMVTGKHSTRAAISYDSQLKRYYDAEAAVEDGADRSRLKSAASVTASPNVVRGTDEWLARVTKPVIQFSTLPPMPEVAVPEMPKIAVPKLAVPKIVLTKVAIPHVVQSKAELLGKKFNKLASKSPAVLGGPKYADGYINGGFRIGSSTDPFGDSKLSSGTQTTPISPVDPRFVTILYRSGKVEQNETIDEAPIHNSRPVRSVDAGGTGRYFRFIQSNDAGRCIALMVCSMAAHPQEFGAYGREVVRFFDDAEPSALSPMRPYKEASRIGRSGDSCRSRYPSCQVDPKYLAQLGESHVVYT